jgi:hypothetical protein
LALIASGSLYYHAFQRKTSGTLLEHAAGKILSFEPESSPAPAGAGDADWLGQFAAGD